MNLPVCSRKVFLFCRQLLHKEAQRSVIFVCWFSYLMNEEVKRMSLNGSVGQRVLKDTKRRSTAH